MGGEMWGPRRSTDGIRLGKKLSERHSKPEIYDQEFCFHMALPAPDQLADRTGHGARMIWRK